MHGISLLTVSIHHTHRREFSIRYSTINRLTLPENHDKRLNKRTHHPMFLSYGGWYRNMTTKALVGQFPLLPLHHARYNFGRQRALFERSAQADELLSILGSYSRASSKQLPMPTVKKVVAFACYSVAWDREGSSVSARQHALALFLRQHLEKQGHIVEYFAQEPQCTPIDREIFEDKEVDIKILDDPWGFIEVDDETLVISFAPLAPVRQIVADTARPAMMIWDRVPKPVARDPDIDPSSIPLESI